MKLTPYIFLLLLVLVLIFILGVRYGQKVELTNKTINYLISIPPTKPPKPTEPPLTFSQYMHKQCGISFLTPSNLTKSKETTQSAQFSDQKGVALAFSCEKKTIGTTDAISVSTDSIRLNNQSIKKINVKADGREFNEFRLRNPLNGSIISITILPSYLPLLDRSLEYN